LLHRVVDGKWGLVGGVIDGEEDSRSAAIREIQEEIGYSADSKELEYIGTWTERRQSKTIEFVGYRIKLKSPIHIILNKAENDSFMWSTPEDCMSNPDLLHTIDRILEDTGYIKKSGTGRI
jgi:8-oxo-dGTP pyrophosphatase MutT (NUDIX family)